jgi:hypothetical protein
MGCITSGSTLNRGEIEGIFMVEEKEKQVEDERSAHLTCFCKTEVVESKKEEGQSVVMVVP